MTEQSSVPNVGGVMTSDYEKYVQGLFDTKSGGVSKAKPLMQTELSAQAQLLTNVSPQVLLRMDQMDKQYGDRDKVNTFAPLELLYRETGGMALNTNPTKFDVYEAKKSTEYQQAFQKSRSDARYKYKVQNQDSVQGSVNAPRTEPPERYRVSADTRHGTKTPNNVSNMLVDFADLPVNRRQLGTNRNRLTDNSYLQSRDSRILGSDFAIVTMHRDPWFDKVDKLLEEARSGPR